MLNQNFLGQGIQLGANLIGGLVGGQGFNTSSWPATDPQQFARNQAEQWRSIEFDPSKYQTDNANLNQLYSTGDRSMDALIAYSDRARQQNKQDAAELLEQSANRQRQAAFEFTMPALNAKIAGTIAQEFVRRPQTPIVGLGWLPNPQNNVVRGPLG